MTESGLTQGKDLKTGDHYILGGNTVYRVKYRLSDWKKSAIGVESVRGKLHRDGDAWNGKACLNPRRWVKVVPPDFLPVS